MKRLNKTLFVAAIAATFSLTNLAVASPKEDSLRETRMVKGTPATPVVSVGSASSTDGIAASPKMRQNLNEAKMVASNPSTGMASVDYKPVGNDGIAASPKLRQQLNEHETQFMVAPLK